MHFTISIHSTSQHHYPATALDMCCSQL